MANERIIASSLRNVEHIAIFDDIIKERFGTIDKTAFFIYLVDIVKDQALIFLAMQFDVLGFRGWALVQTDPDRRELIKKALKVHRLKGTPYAVKAAISTAVAGINYEDVTIQERLISTGFLYDGAHNYNGSETYGYGHWAIFRVIIDVTGYGTLTADIEFLILKLILYYKGTRNWLRDLTFSTSYTDEFETEDEFLINVGENFDEDLNMSFLYDGQNLYDASRQWQNDIFEIIIFQPPIVDFEADNTSPVYDDSINFTDLSEGDPTSWSWEYTDPDSITSVFSTAQNPSLLVNKVGLWTIKLTATNAQGSNFLTKTNYINVSAAPETAYHRSRILAAGGDYVDSWVERIVLTALSKFETSIGGMRSKIVRLELPIIGSGAIAKMVPYLFNRDGSTTPIGNAISTNNGFVDADCLEGAGRKGNGVSKFTQTGIVPSVELGQDNCGIFVYVVEDSYLGREIGMQDANCITLAAQIAGDGYYVLNNVSFTNISPAVSPALIGVLRNGPGAFDYYNIQNSIVTAAGYTSISNMTMEITPHCVNHYTVNQVYFSDANQWMVLITDGITVAEYGIFRTAFLQLLTDLGL